MIAIKQLTKDDIIIVHQLAKDIWPDVYKDIISKDQIDYMLEWMYNVNTLTEQVQIGYLYYMVTHHGVPKGFVGLEPNFPQAGTLRMHKLYVNIEDQGAGLGKALLEKSIEVANQLDLATINLNVNRFNKAVDFYKYSGFEVVEEVNINIGKGYLMEDYVMVRSV
ncbi:MAG: N-acetylglutamate synthase-like GNAT family acetyltransferase [Crocinitomicaceae bacterium]|jgi:N-acetylglutamate synthase-like GNAT family acetyltransferase